MYFIANCMMRGDVPAASDVTFPKSGLFIAETGLFGVIAVEDVEDLPPELHLLRANPERPRHPRVDVHRPGPRMASSGIVP